MTNVTDKMRHFETNVIDKMRHIETNDECYR